MNKVITINLNGVAFQLEEAGYGTLHDYLGNAARRLEGNPDKDEILADIERAIADKFRAMLGSYKTVIVTKEVEGVIAEMGPVQDASADEPAAADGTSAGAQAPRGSATEEAGGPRPARRLYRIQEGAMFSGVCNGLAAHFNVDVTLVRVAFVLLALTWGAGLMVYLVMSFIVPLAHTPEEKTAAFGPAATAQEFIRRAKAGYYEGMKTWHDKSARREWKRKFRQEMRGWKYNFDRSMHDSAQQWQQAWAPPEGAPHPRFWVGLGFTLMILKWMRLVVFALMLYALYTLVAHGHVFGFALPADIPTWVGVIGVIALFQIVSWPLRAMRYSCYFPGRPHWVCWGGPGDGLVRLGLFIAVIWLADHHVPQVHDFLQHLPAELHRAADAVRDWWNSKG